MPRGDLDDAPARLDLASQAGEDLRDDVAQVAFAADSPLRGVDVQGMVVGRAELLEELDEQLGPGARAVGVHLGVADDHGDRAVVMVAP